MAEKISKGAPAHMMFKGHLGLTARVLSLTLAPIVMLATPAYFLDKRIGTFPLFFLIALGLAFVLAQVIVYKVFTSVTKEKPHGGN